MARIATPAWAKAAGKQYSLAAYGHRASRRLYSRSIAQRCWEGALQAWIHYILSEPISASLRIVISVSVGLTSAVRLSHGRIDQ